MKSSSAAARPMILSVLCVLGLFGCFLKTIMVVSPPVQMQGRWYAVYLSLSAVLLIACLCGIWLMKKWGFWALSVYVLVDQSVYYLMGLWQPIGMLLVVLILGITLIYYRRLN